MNIFKKITQFYENNLPFVVYRKPNQNEISGFFMQDDSLFFTDNFSETGFVFAPFNTDEKAILFPSEKAEFIQEELILNDFTFDENDYLVDIKSKENHIKIVEKAIDEIDKSDLQKVVISRKEEVQLSDFELLLGYQKLLKKYKNAFVYVWFHPKVGLWLGATPETLLQIFDTNFKTMSLAGTQVVTNDSDENNVVWKSKELEEQQLVTDFIESQLATISSNLKIDKTETIRAGNLLHLRTKVEGELNKKSTLKSLIRSLHPTPAVCGLPRNMARDFIINNENYNRSFYTGFLGELNVQDLKLNVQSSQLYVNLRCMEINNNKASIYVGGGITKDSIPKNEWKETVSKSETMKKVL
ncbi:chorismate-binding protein [Polaribacter sp. Hel_I_88]|uniref:chorismate-binding protein n=1 Tax=Polaribacter sp. Hel_I_88 TaxID=1250006 RepID=UPI000A8B3D3C|nr:chorismate-binding protein [Polaribacter sp. Hel_I_88]